MEAWPAALGLLDTFLRQQGTDRAAATTDNTTHILRVEVHVVDPTRAMGMAPELAAYGSMRLTFGEDQSVDFCYWRGGWDALDGVDRLFPAFDGEEQCPWSTAQLLDLLTAWPVPVHAVVVLDKDSIPGSNTPQRRRRESTPDPP